MRGAGNRFGVDPSLRGPGPLNHGAFRRARGLTGRPSPADAPRLSAANVCVRRIRPCSANVCAPHARQGAPSRGAACSRSRPCEPGRPGGSCGSARLEPIQMRACAARTRRAAAGFDRSLFVTFVSAPFAPGFRRLHSARWIAWSAGIALAREECFRIGPCTQCLGGSAAGPRSAPPGCRSPSPRRARTRGWAACKVQQPTAGRRGDAQPSGFPPRVTPTIARVSDGILRAGPAGEWALRLTHHPARPPR